ncbi:MAG TPA: NAD-dependent epimerase/dehydratase family protein [Desulfobacterales bacterium]|nr:NAD-dependent epimerase/dehydratase family protein [Desulfobacterales bacterium]
MVDVNEHKFARLTFERKPIPIYGDGSSLRDYTYVGDIVEGIRRAMHYEEANMG